MALGFGIGGLSLLTGDKDIESIWTGGQTEEEAAIQTQRERAIEAAYQNAMSQVGNQYFGQTGQNAAEIARLQKILDDPMWKGSTAPGDVEARGRIQDQINNLTRQIDETTTYKPTTYNPITGYDVVGYDPTQISAQFEAERAALNPDLYNAPDYEDAAMQGPSEAAKARADAEALASSKAALGSLEDVYQQGGMTAADKARQEQIQAANAREERAAREAIMANAAERGQATSGTNTMALLNSAQGTANRNRAQGMDVEIAAEQRALQAMRDAGTLGRTLAQDEYGRQYQTGAAADEVNRFNTLGQRDVQAAERNAADTYADWQRGMLGRDVDRATAAEQWNANEANKAKYYGANEMNQMNRWGADANNTARRDWSNAWNNAKMYNANVANSNVGGYNTQQGTLGNMYLGKAGALDAIYASQPTADYGQAITNMWNLDQAIGDEAQQWNPYSGGGMTGGGGGGTPLSFG